MIESHLPSLVPTEKRVLAERLKLISQDIEAAKAKLDTRKVVK